MRATESGSARAGITLHHPAAFWLGAATLTLGVILHLPMFLRARDMGFELAGMALDTPMKVGMALIMIGLVATFY